MSGAATPPRGGAGTETREDEAAMASQHRRWLVALGSVLALCWELGEWYTFIRHGTEIDTAYEDTLADQALGTLGAVVAGLLVGRVAPRRPM